MQGFLQTEFFVEFLKKKVLLYIPGTIHVENVPATPCGTTSTSNYWLKKAGNIFPQKIKLNKLTMGNQNYQQG